MPSIWSRSLRISPDPRGEIDRHVPAGLVEGDRLLPGPPVERHRQVLDEDDRAGPAAGHVGRTPCRTPTSAPPQPATQPARDDPASRRRCATSSGPARPWRRASAHSSPMADRSPAAAASAGDADEDERPRTRVASRASRRARIQSSASRQSVACAAVIDGRSPGAVQMDSRSGQYTSVGAGGRGTQDPVGVLVAAERSHRTGSRGAASAGRRWSTSRPCPRRHRSDRRTNRYSDGCSPAAGGRLRQAAVAAVRADDDRAEADGLSRPPRPRSSRAAARAWPAATRRRRRGRRPTRRSPRARRRCGPRRRRPTPGRAIDVEARIVDRAAAPPRSRDPGRRRRRRSRAMGGSGRGRWRPPARRGRAARGSG